MVTGRALLAAALLVAVLSGCDLIKIPRETTEESVYLPVSLSLPSGDWRVRRYIKTVWYYALDSDSFSYADFELFLERGDTQLPVSRILKVQRRGAWETASLDSVSDRFNVLAKADFLVVNGEMVVSLGAEALHHLMTDCPASPAGDCAQGKCPAARLWGRYDVSRGDIRIDRISTMSYTAAENRFLGLSESERRGQMVDAARAAKNLDFQSRHAEILKELFRSSVAIESGCVLGARPG